MMNQLIFGMRYSREDELWQRLQQLRDEGIKMIGVCGIVNFLPVVRWLLNVHHRFTFSPQTLAKCGQENPMDQGGSEGHTQVLIAKVETLDVKISHLEVNDSLW